MSQLTHRLTNVVGRYVQAVVVMHFGTFVDSHERVPQPLECFLVRCHGSILLDPSPLASALR